jgi:hypothetical protein
MRDPLSANAAASRAVCAGAGDLLVRRLGQAPSYREVPRDPLAGRTVPQSHEAQPRSPGYSEERLNLTWWVAIRLEQRDGTSAALWGLGGPSVDGPYCPRRSWASSSTPCAATSRSAPGAHLLRARLATA